MKESKPSRAAYWLLINGVFAACGYFGLIESIEGARRVFIFACWTCAIISILAVCNPEIHVRCYERGPSVPRFIACTFDAVIAVALVWFGYFAAAAFYAVGASFEHYIFTVSPKTLEPNE